MYVQYTILADEREAVPNRVNAREVPSVAYFAVPVHPQGAFSGLGHQPGDFPVTEQVASKCLSLRMSPYLTTEDQKLIASAF